MKKSSTKSAAVDHSSKKMPSKKPLNDYFKKMLQAKENDQKQFTYNGGVYKKKVINKKTGFEGYKKVIPREPKKPEKKKGKK